MGHDDTKQTGVSAANPCNPTDNWTQVTLHWRFELGYHDIQC
jgi:hypothetical protein